MPAKKELSLFSFPFSFTEPSSPICSNVIRAPDGLHTWQSVLLTNGFLRTELIGLLGLPCGSDSKESAYNVEDLGLIPGLGRSPIEGKCYPLQCSGLGNSVDCIVHRLAKSRTQLSDFHFHGKKGES